MRLIRLGIEHFRAMENLSSPELAASGLVVVGGLNEAGKTTLLHFVRELLFGFSRESSEAGRPPAAGWADLILDSDGQRVRWERRLGGRQRQGGEVRLLPAGRGEPEQLLGNISAEQFNNVFALGLDELEKVKSIQAVNLGGQLYAAAGLGALALRLPDLERTLDQELATVLAPRSNKARINVLLRDLDALAQRQRELEKVASRYEEGHARLDALRQRLAALQQREKELTVALARQERLLQAWPAWERLDRAYRLIMLVPDRPGYHRDSLTRLAEREKAIQQAQQEMEESAQARAEVQARLDRIQVDEALLSQEALWRELEEDAPRWAQTRQAWQAVQGQLAADEALIGNSLAELGVGWTRERVAQVDASLTTQGEVSDWRKRYERLEMERDQQQRQLAALRAASARPNPEGPDALPTEGALSQRQAVLRQALADLRQLQSDLQELAARQTQLGSWERSQRASEPVATYLQRVQGVQPNREGGGSGQSLSAQSGAESAKPGSDGREARWASAWRRAFAAAGVGLLIGVGLRFAGLANGSAMALGVVGAVAVWFALLFSEGRREEAERTQRQVWSELVTQLSEAARWQQTEGDQLRRQWAAAEATVRHQQDSVLAQLRQLFGSTPFSPPQWPVPHPLAAERPHGQAPSDRSTSHVPAEIDAQWKQDLRPWEAAISTWQEWVAGWGDRLAAEISRVEREQALQDDNARQIQRAEQLLQALARQQEQWQAGWNRVVEHLDLSPELRPDTVLQLLQKVERIQQRLAEQQQRRQEAERLAGELAHFVQRFRAAVAATTAVAEPAACPESATAELAAAHLESAATDQTGSLPVNFAQREAECWAQLSEWRERLATARQARTERERERVVLADAQRVEQRSRQRWEQARRELQELLQAGEADSPDTFRQRAQEAEQRRQLTEQAKSEAAALCAVMQWPVGLERDLAAVVTRARAELGATSLAEIKAQLAAVEGERQRVVQERDEATRQEATGQKELDELAASEELAQAQQAAAELRTSLQQAAAQAAILCIAQGMLAQIRRRYEEERQPAVLRRAADYLSRMTAQRYRRLVVPLASSTGAGGAGIAASHDEFRVERADGQYLSPQQLSRGTAEQLYLAIRLALAEDFAKRTTSLPVLLDDVLVNFDPQRLQGALAAVAELSRQLQVFVFTCHPHVVRAAAEAARQAGTGCQILQLADTHRLVAVELTEIERMAVARGG